MEENLAFYFGRVRRRQRLDGVSKDVFLMFQVHHPVCLCREERRAYKAWKALQPKIFLNHLGKVQLKSKSYLRSCFKPSEANCGLATCLDILLSALSEGFSFTASFKSHVLRSRKPPEHPYKFLLY